jgi:hypothetical protein
VSKNLTHESLRLKGENSFELCKRAYHIAKDCIHSGQGVRLNDVMDRLEQQLKYSKQQSK